MKFQPDDDFIGYDVADGEDNSRKQIVIAPPLQGSVAENKWLFIAAAVVAFLVLTKKKR
jgi:hypothetical protein